MSAPLVVPFNFEPASVSVKTSSYTIPAGKYAYVYVECVSGGIFSINATNAVVSAAALNIDVYSPSATATYNAPSFGRAEFSVFALGTNGSITINGNPIGYANGTGYIIGPNGSVSAISGSGGSAAIQGAFIPDQATSKTASFWLPSGTVISGSGDWRATLMEFNQIS